MSVGGREGRPPKVRPEDRHALRRDGCDREPPAGLLRGIEQFNAGEYWECHETLEEIWIEEPGDIRYLYQGILLVGVGLLHLRRRNHHGAVVKLRSGLELLQAFEPECMGVQVARLRKDAKTFLALLSEGPHRMDEALRLGRPRCEIHHVSVSDSASRKNSLQER